MKYASRVPASKQNTKGLAAIFSRNSEDLSKKYPDVLAKLNKVKVCVFAFDILFYNGEACLPFSP